MDNLCGSVRAQVHPSNTASVQPGQDPAHVTPWFIPEGCWILQERTVWVHTYIPPALFSLSGRILAFQCEQYADSLKQKCLGEEVLCSKAVIDHDYIHMSSEVFPSADVRVYTSYLWSVWPKF